VTPVPPPQQQIKQQAQSPPQDGDSGPSTGHGQFQGLKMIANPPNLEAWRRRLFDVDDMITLDEDE
jgi:glutathione S-transferase